MFDDDAQPLTTFNRTRREGRDSNELIGVIRGILADGQLVDSEIEFLARWLVTNQEFAAIWPFDALICRVGAALEDGRIDDDERAELRELMTDIIGDPSPSRFVNAPTTLPLTKPAPPIDFGDNEFVLTGKFAFGPRKRCQLEISNRGGICGNYVTRRTRYLVIGAMSSRDWVYTTHGRKIESAVEHIEKGSAVAIVSEEHWAHSL